MKALEAHELEKDTLVIFTSDNGPWSVFGPHGGTAAPLRGEKSTSWEGGSRVPGIFHWPDRIAPGVVEGIGVNLDLYATFAALTGAKDLPTDKPGWMSTDLTPALFDDQPSPRTEWFYGGGAIRSGDFKLVTTTHFPTNPETRKNTPRKQHDPPLLFNLREDIGETNNIAADHPEKVTQLLEKLIKQQSKP